MPGPRSPTIVRRQLLARGGMFVPEGARFANLPALPEGADVATAINNAMKSIEAENEELKDVSPKSYKRVENSTLVELLPDLNDIPMNMEGDT